MVGSTRRSRRAPGTRPGSAPRHRARAQAMSVAMLALALAATGARADTSGLAAPIDLVLDRAPLELVLDEIAAAAGLERVDAPRRGVLVSGRLAGSARSVLAGLVAEHALSLDIVGDRLGAVPDTARQVVVLVVPEPARTASAIARMPAAKLPGNLVGSTAEAVVVAGHPAFVMRAATGAAIPPRRDGPATQTKLDPKRQVRDPDEIAASRPTAGARSRVVGDGSPGLARPAPFPAPSPSDGPPVRTSIPASASRAASSVEDIPGFY